MATTIKHIRSAVAGNTPTTSQLELGVLAINTTDGKVFIKKSVSGTESIVEIGGNTAAEILAAIKTVDGANSGLDADTLDGIQASNFLKSNENDSFDGNTLTFSSNTNDPVVLIKGNGPNFITFASNASGTVDSESIDLVYRSTPNTLGFERSSDASVLFKVDADNKRATFGENIVVPGTVDGRDLSVDGSKLDGIEAGATGDQTAAEILTAIKTVDGATSGLDADTLDGVEGALYETKADKEFFSITNSGTTAGTWLGSHSDITAYFDGMTIAFYQNNIAGANTTTININNLGAKTIYYANDSKLTTQYGKRALIMLQYDSDQDRFYAHDFYYASDDYRMRWQNDLIAGAQVDGYQLLMEGIDGKLYPVTAGGVSTNAKTVSTQELRVGGLMLYYESGTNYSADAVITANHLYTSIYATTMENWHNYDAGWATTDKPWYIVCTMNANGNFVLDNSSLTAFLTQTLPSSDDGKFYIMGGWMHNNHDEFRLQIDHPIYVYKNGAVRMFSGYSGDADKLDGQDSAYYLNYNNLTNKPGNTQSPITFTEYTISSNITFASGYNGLSVGPVEVANGVTVEVPQNSCWRILD